MHYKQAEAHSKEDMFSMGLLRDRVGDGRIWGQDVVGKGVFLDVPSLVLNSVIYDKDIIGRMDKNDNGRDEGGTRECHTNKLSSKYDEGLPSAPVSEQR